MIDRLLKFVYKPGYKAFNRALGNLEQAQLKRLELTLTEFAKTKAGADLGVHSEMSLEAFRNLFPISDYDDWKPWVEKEQASKNQICISRVRFQPTSGSSSHRKWIPYSRSFLREFNAASDAWLYDLMITHPEAFKGKQYWSLSWLPNELRSIASNDDLELFSFLTKTIMRRVMAVPTDISQVRTSQAAVYATSVYLAAESKLSLFSVWSPTFALELIKNIKVHKLDIAKDLSEGKWSGPHSKDLHAIPCPKSKKASNLLNDWEKLGDVDFFEKLWPDLKLLSCWTSSTSSVWSQELKAYFPNVPIQGKGLWATEAVVTVPFQNRYPLAVQSHFYEFRCLNSQKVYTSWELEEGMIVQPITTSSNGLMRYSLPDRLKVTGFLKETPCFEFLGRISSVDMVGEKIDANLAVQTLEFWNKQGARGSAVSLIGHNTKPCPSYSLLIESPDQNLNTDKASEELEAHLSKFHHYKLARELNQLAPAKVNVQKNALDYYLSLRPHMTKGDQKIEPLLQVGL